MHGESLTRLLARAGFAHTRRAAAMLQEDALAPVLGRIEPDECVRTLIRDLGRVADPDLALLTLVRLVEAAEHKEPMHERSEERRVGKEGRGRGARSGGERREGRVRG